MEIQYKGTQNGKPLVFTMNIHGNNLSKTSSNYEIDLTIGDKPLPFFTTAIHQSLYNCLKEIYLFIKFNNIVFDEASEVIAPKLNPYDLVLFNSDRHILFMA